MHNRIRLKRKNNNKKKTNQEEKISVMNAYARYKTAYIDDGWFVEGKSMVPSGMVVLLCVPCVVLYVQN